MISAPFTNMLWKRHFAKGCPPGIPLNSHKDPHKFGTTIILILQMWK
jgi:hypothetical protein